jgi:hypothetical protein
VIANPPQDAEDFLRRARIVAGAQKPETPFSIVVHEDAHRRIERGIEILHGFSR